MQNENSAANQNTEQNQNAASLPSTETLPANIIGVTVTFDKPITLHLRMMSLNEEKEMRQSLFGLTDEEKEKSAFRNNVNFLKKIEARKPDGIDNFDEYFAEVNPVNERIAEYAVRAYFLKLTPNVSFLVHSA